MHTKEILMQGTSVFNITVTNARFVIFFQRRVWFNWREIHSCPSSDAACRD